MRDENGIYRPTHKEFEKEFNRDMTTNQRVDYHHADREQQLYSYTKWLEKKLKELMK